MNARGKGRQSVPELSGLPHADAENLPDSDGPDFADAFDNFAAALLITPIRQNSLRAAWWWRFRLLLPIPCASSGPYATKWCVLPMPRRWRRLPRL